MKIIRASYDILHRINGLEILKAIEQAGRTCYKSESYITEESAIKFVENLAKNNHEAMLEHQSVSVRIVCDRGVSHEIVRHRIASFAQESTRYCNYSKDKFNGELTFIKPCFWDVDSPVFKLWQDAMQASENYYLHMIEQGITPQEARGVLPNSLKTEIIVTMNLREWRHFFRLRALGRAGKPHPQMLEIAVPMLEEFKKLIPVVFDSL
jgi:thymidylate synthase (FAD)